VFERDEMPSDVAPSETYFSISCFHQISGELRAAASVAAIFHTFSLIEESGKKVIRDHFIL